MTAKENNKTNHPARIPRFALHAIFWAVVYTVLFLFNKITGNLFRGPGWMALFFLSLPLPVYLHFYLLERFFNKKRYVLYIAGVILLIPSFVLFSRLFFHPSFRAHNGVLTFLVNFSMFLIITTGLKFLRSSLRQTDQLRRWSEQQYRVELELLKTRVNPGLMLDKLDELHRLSLEKSPDVPARILELSESMRRTADGGGGEGGTGAGRSTPPAAPEEKEDQPVQRGQPEQQGPGPRDDVPGDSLPLGIWFGRPALHLYWWIFLAATAFWPWRQTPTTVSTVEVFCLFFFLVLPIDLHFYLLARFFNRNRLALYGFSLAAGLGLCAYGMNSYFRYFFGAKDPFAKTLLEVVMLVVIVTAMKVVKDGFKRKLMLQEIRTRQVRTELDLLRAQVNPHFLFNTLNNLYAISLDAEQRLPGLIRRLSQLMEYMLRVSPREQVKLEEEFNFLLNYLELEKLRLPPANDISLEMIGDIVGKSIAPMLFIPFVENCFKHGAKGAVQGIFVHLKLVVDRDKVTFFARNNRGETGESKNNKNGKNPRRGVGLKNVKRRLQLLYPGRHHLKIEPAGDSYSVTLELWG